MSQADLIWGAFSLMLLGALVSMCMKCQRAENKQKTSLESQRNRCAAVDYTTPAMRERHSAQPQRHPHTLGYEEQQRVEVVHSCSMPRQEHLKMPCNIPGPRKSHEVLSVASLLEACAAPRYQNVEKANPSMQSITTAENSQERQAMKIPLIKMWLGHLEATDVSWSMQMSMRTVQSSSYGKPHRLQKTFPLTMNQITSMQVQTAGFLPENRRRALPRSTEDHLGPLSKDYSLPSSYSP